MWCYNFNIIWNVSCPHRPIYMDNRSSSSENWVEKSQTFCYQKFFSYYFSVHVDLLIGH